MIPQLMDPVLVRHQGVLLAIAGSAVPGDARVFWNVLDVSVGTTEYGQGWSGFQELDLPKELRPAGLSLVDVPIDPKATGTAADAPVTVLSDEKFLFLVRPSTTGSAWIDRLVLIDQGTDRVTGRPVRSLEPAWEVRFTGSARKDVPGSPTDAQGYLATDGKPFIAPTVELPMVRLTPEGSLTALFVPAHGGAALRWVIVSAEPSPADVKIWSFPRDADGMPDLAGAPLDPVTLSVLPDIKLSLAADSGRLDLLTGLASSLYMTQERINTGPGEGTRAKRSGRVALAGTVARAGEQQSLGTALLDFAVAADGRLAPLPETTKLGVVQPANTCLSFDGTAFVQIADPAGSLKLDGSFTLEAWTCPEAVAGAPSGLVLGGAGAPTLRIVPGAGIELRYRTDSGEVICTSTNTVLRRSSWQHVAATFDGSALSLFVNGDPIPVTTSGTPAPPVADALDVMGDDFVGRLDELRVWNLARTSAELKADLFRGFDNAVPDGLVGYWPLLVLDGHTTPDESGHDCTGTLHGAVPVPSDSPMTPTTAAIETTTDGLTSYAGLLEFAHAKATPCLREGSDGLLHLYFAAFDDAFSVARYDTGEARASFAGRWVAEDQAGQVQFVARQAGPVVNSATPSIQMQAEHGLLTVDLPDGTGLSERWTGVPQDLVRMLEVLAGAAASQPTDPRLAVGDTAFFDYGGAYRQVRIPAGNGALAIVSTDPRLGLRRVGFTPASNGRGTLGVTFDVDGWAGGFTQTWPAVPDRPDLLQAVLSGLAAGYDYGAVTLSAVPAVELAMGGSTFGVVADPESADELTVVLENASSGAALAKATITLTQGAAVKTAVWDEVPRTDADLADVLTGEDPDYDYATHASGDWQAVTALVAVLSDDIGVVLANQAGRPSTDPMLAAPLFRAIGESATGIIGAFDETAAVLQSAVASDGADLSGGSRRYAVFGDGGPTNGHPAAVQPDSPLPLLHAGVSGGWLAPKAPYDLAFDGVGSVDVDVLMPTADVLAMPGDVTVETWVRPRRQGALHHLVTFQHQPDAKDPETDSEYGIGLTPSYTLQFVSGTEVRTTAADLSPLLSGNDYTVELLVRPNLQTLGDGTGTIWNLSGAGRLATNKVGDLFMELPGGANLSFGRKLQDQTWQQITVTRSPDGTMKGYIDGVEDTSRAASSAVPPNSFSLGGGSGPYALEQQINDVRIWNRALSAAEVAAGYGHPVSGGAAGLTLLWLLGEGTGKVAINTAYGVASPSVFDGRITSVNPQPLWVQSGAYAAFFGRRLGEAQVTPGGLLATNRWTHLAAVYRGGHAIQLDGQSFGQAPDDASLDMTDGVSVTAWVTPGDPPKDGGQAIVTKWAIEASGQSYSLGLDPSMRPTFTVRAGSGELFTATASKPIPKGAAAFLAGTFDVTQAEPSGTEREPRITVTIKLYVDGVEVGNVAPKTGKDLVLVNVTNSPLRFGRDSTGRPYAGRLAGVSLWSRALTAAEVQPGGAPATGARAGEGRVSAWDFSEGSGNVAYDDQGENNVTLSADDLWRRFPLMARLDLYVDGEQVPTVERRASTFGPVLGDAMVIGKGLDGELREVRVWNRARTRAQIDGAKNQPLSGGESGLVGYWPLTDASGRRPGDLTGNGNAGILSTTRPPVWTPSTAPVGDEPPEIDDVLGGQRSSWVATITGSPSLADYPVTIRDAYGDLQSTMELASAYTTRSGPLELRTGFSVGELERQFLGQVQTQPTLVGYVEGSPPLPSENLTRPMWEDPSSSEYLGYQGTSKLVVQSAEETLYNIGSTKSTGLDISTSAQAGMLFKNESQAGFAALFIKTSELTGHAGITGQLDYSKGDQEGSQLSADSLRSSNLTMSVTGNWEPAGDVLNADVGRRWVPDNIGIALVRSLTADLYALRLKGTGVLVALTTVPNLDIPEDVNLIPFPIDPRYTSNGTLDGKVGATVDPMFPNAELRRGSYFKPIEAYALKRRAERESQALEAFYRQFDAAGRGQGNDPGLAEQVEDDPWYDWAKAQARRSIANTYVWSASGGLYAEQEQVKDTHTESLGGTYHLAGKAGVHLDGEAVFFVGLYGQFDYLMGGHVDVAVTKAKADSGSFGLDTTLGGEGWLPFWKDADKDWTAAPCPGKVESYRFMSFYLSPSAENGDTFFNGVVDPYWLHASTDDRAVALRGARSDGNGVWRVLHRVTYVRRVPPRLSLAAVQTPRTTTMMPHNVEANAELLELIALALPVHEGRPTPAQIGDAVRQVIDKSLLDTLPWWEEFVHAATVVGSPEMKALARLRREVFEYAKELYAATAEEPALTPQRMVATEITAG